MVSDLADSSGLMAQLQRFIEAAPCAMLLVGEDGRIVLVNSQAEPVFHYARDEMVGQAVELLVPVRFVSRSLHIATRIQEELRRSFS